jgi:hypothetical protein
VVFTVVKVKGSQAEACATREVHTLEPDSAYQTDFSEHIHTALVRNAG